MDIPEINVSKMLFGGFTMYMKDLIVNTTVINKIENSYKSDIIKTSQNVSFNFDFCNCY